MPELPEVQSVVNYIKPRILNQTIESIISLNDYEKVFDTLSSIKINNLLKDKTINDVWRRGKYIILDIDQAYLCIHLRMTGQLKTKLEEDDDKKHFSVQIQFKNGEKLLFKDYRKFGRFYYWKSLTPLENKLGCEPLSKSFNFNYLFSRLNQSRGMIKPLLLNQSFIAGLGNIYVDESLWKAKIHPSTPSMKISRIKIKKLHEAIPTTLQNALNYNGTTIINFSFGNSIEGGYKKYLSVFGKQGERCKRCSTIIKKIYVCQRGTHFCPKCQKK